MVSIEEIQAAYYMVAATGVLVAAIYYILNLRVSQKNQALTLEVRQADIIKSWASTISLKETVKAFSDVVFNQEYSTFEEWAKKYGHDNLEAYNNYNITMNLSNSYGVLYEKKLMDIETIEKLCHTLTILLIWRKLEPVIKGMRRLYNEPNYCLPFEHLAEAISKRLR
jgi:hypothetical protein